MAKDWGLTLSITIIGILLVALLGCVGFYLRELVLKLDNQSNQIAKLEKNFAIIVSFLNTKMPSANLPALVTLSDKKNVSPEKVAVVIPMLEKDPAQAKAYLEKQLYFNAQEVKAVMSAPNYNGYPNPKPPTNVVTPPTWEQKQKPLY